MIWVRRALIAPLSLLLCTLLVLALVLLQIGDTFLKPSYYLEQLRKANIYDFVLLDVTTSVLDEAREVELDGFPEGLNSFEENPLLASGLTTEDIVTSLNVAFPPKWIEDLAEQVFFEVVPYMTSDRDQFTVTLKAKGRAVAVVGEIKELLRNADAYSLLFDEYVAPAIDKAVVQQLPFGLEISSQFLQQAVRRTVTPEWVQTQVEHILDQVTPYLVGDEDTFEISVQLAGRTEIAVEEIKTVFRKAEVYGLLYEEVIGPAMSGFLDESVHLPFGFEVTRDEVLQSLRGVAPLDWVQEQIEDVIDQTAPYIIGKADDFNVVVDITDNKREARGVLRELVASRVREEISKISRCGAGRTPTFASAGLPNCVPPGFTVDAVMRPLEDHVVAATASILGKVPDEIRFTEALLRQGLPHLGAEDNVQLIDELREFMKDGWTYTDRDLRHDLRYGFDGEPVFAGDRGDEQAVKLLDDIRVLMAEGWTYTHEDLRNYILAATDPGTLGKFDSAREMFGYLGTFKLLIYLPMLVVLVSIGFLGGRGWSGRFLWASWSLLLAATAVLIVSWPVYATIGHPSFDEVALAEEFKATQLLVTNKLLEVVVNVVDDFAAGLRSKSLILVIVGLVGIAVSLSWDRLMIVAGRRNVSLAEGYELTES